MRKTLVAIFALGALATAAAAAPAMADPHGGPPGGYDHSGPGPGGPGGPGGYDHRGPDDRGWGDLRGRIDAVLAKVDRALHSDRLTRSERNSLSYRANKLSTLERRYERGGIRGYERADLENQIRDLDARVDRATYDDHRGDHHDDRGGYRR